MRKFIAFIILSLPVVAILSTFAGFYYAGKIKPAQPISQPAQVLNVATIPAPTAAPVRTEASERLLKIQLSFCFDAMRQLASAGRLQDVNGVRICANNLRTMNPPAAYQADAYALADQFAGFADEYEAGLRNTDPAMIKAAGQRIQPIGETLKRMVATLPE